MLSTNVNGLLALVLVLRHGKHIAEALFDQLNELVMVLDSSSNNDALFGSDVVHHELLQHARIDITDVVSAALQRHTQGVVAVCSPAKKFLVPGEGVELMQVVREIMRLLVLRLSHVGSEDRTGLQRDIDHHLEHVNGVVFEALALEKGALLVIVHCHVAARHLDHAVVDRFICMLECLQVSVLES